MQPDHALRARIADTASALGPDAPTLDDPWTVRDLLAHLVLRSTRPDAVPGIGVPLGFLRRHTAAVQERIAQEDFERTLALFRQGPPRWSPARTALVGRLVETPELAVHLEDMVRAQPDWRPTEHDGSVQSALWGSVRRSGPVLYRSAPVGVVAVAPGRGRASLRRPRAGTGTVVLRGTPLELLLHAFGRTSASLAVVEGADADVAALAAHDRSL
ncbi:TIGR03085 family metal-binding protein [Ornithinimicrobium avium]|uniref:TIGR03085 family protein n=1 Tax=Ornithinimicrobium avium TaxID=2283195 RepID=A0A345NJ95_9MICO|nr:TIGR03085 family metal-binding protein [Ornithinimicrobium avium]AXH95103.1 TIGR03085 family protein [Ornithinimicrobium avium]